MLGPTRLVALISYRSRGDLPGLLVPRITAQRVHAARIPLSTPTITPDPSSVSLPPKKTVDYVHSVCVAIYGFNLTATMFGVTRPPTRIAAVEKL